MSKKETEFDRYERMKKLSKEAEVEKKKSLEAMIGTKKKGGKPKQPVQTGSRNWLKDYELGFEEDEYEM